jgi:hypothetical protein
VKWRDADMQNFKGECYGIVRDIIKHQAITARSSPVVYFFKIDLLKVSSALPGDVPLLVANTCASGPIWLSQEDISAEMFCLRDHDGGEGFYVIEL